MKLINLSKGALKVLGGAVGTLVLLGVTGIVNHCQMAALKDDVVDEVTANILKETDEPDESCIVDEQEG